MRLRHRALAAVAVASAVALVAPKWLWFKRQDLPESFETSVLGADELSLSYALSRQGHDRLLILVHGLLKRMNDPGLVRMAASASDRFDVLTFDQPGHGGSAGTCLADAGQSAAQVARVVAHGRSLGYRRIGVVGYSLGGAGAIVAVAKGAAVDALAVVSSPVRALPSALTNEGIAARSLRLWARGMGTQLGAADDPGPSAIGCLGHMPAVPLLVVHNGRDTLVHRRESQALFAVAREPKSYLHVPRGLHAWPDASAEQILSWMDSVL